MDIVDEACELVNAMIDQIRDTESYRADEPAWVNSHMSQLKDLRALLNLSENFRDDR